MPQSAESIVIEESPAEAVRRQASQPLAELSLSDRWQEMGDSVGPGPFPGFRSPVRSTLWLFRVMTGIVFLVGLLAVLAAVPGLSLLSLGLMLAA